MQRKAWHENHAASLIRSRANYAKHSVKRRQESAAYKLANREYHTLAEWFRRKNIPISHVDPGDIAALVEMKRAVNRAKAVIGRSH